MRNPGFRGCGRILLDRFEDQTGNVAVITALCMTVLLGVLTLVLNTGFLYSQKNTYQNTVEAAALAGAVSFCQGGWDHVESVVREIAEENGISEEDGTLSVTFGYYDETDVYTDFAFYKEFAGVEDMPAEESVNAVLVAFESREGSLTGLTPASSVAAKAVAYLERVDIASLDPQEEIHLGHDSTWKGVVFHSNEDIAYPLAAYASGKSHSPPEFDGCRLFAVGRVLSCPVDVVPFGWFGQRMDIQWGAGAAQSGGGIRSGAPPLTGIPPVDDSYLEAWIAKADVVYTPNQAGVDDVFYGQGYLSFPMGEHWFLDPAEEHGIIFFDARGSSHPDRPLLIGRTESHPPNGEAISNLTVVATCPIRIANLLGTTYTMPDETLYVGGEGMDQALFISAQDIELYPSRGQRLQLDGAVFRTGGDFIWEMGGGGGDHRFRIIADGGVRGEPEVSNYLGDQGLNHLVNDSRFGPPCPPTLPRLGRLVRSGDTP